MCILCYLNYSIFLIISIFIYSAILAGKFKEIYANKTQNNSERFLWSMSLRYSLAIWKGEYL